jgi:hypothetical protein
MQTATIEVTYVGPPKEGKQYGFIKGADNSTFPVKADRIREFQADNTYEVAYTEAPNGFKNIIGVKRIVPQAEQVNYTQRPDSLRDGAEFREPQRNGATLTTAAPAQTKPQTQQYYQPRPTAPKDGKRMCITSLMNAGITSHQIPFTREALAAAFRAVSEAYDDAIAGDGD